MRRSICPPAPSSVSLLSLFLPHDPSILALVLGSNPLAALFISSRFCGIHDLPGNAACSSTQQWQRGAVACRLSTVHTLHSQPTFLAPGCANVHMCRCGKTGVFWQSCMFKHLVTHYAPLFALRSRTLRAFVWQPDLLMVVRYIYDCFQVCARILNPCVDVPSNRPHLAGLM
jgi:hypothetical protein